MSRVTYFGDGAANQGQVYESFNMAELWKLPVVYVIENNRYAMGTVDHALVGRRPTCRSAALSFNIPGEQVDGMDVRAVKAAGEKAAAWCRAGKGPYHSGNADLPLSRPLDVGPGEIPHARGSRQRCAPHHDPIDMARDRILEKKFAKEDELKKIDGDVRDLINQAAEFATHDPEPDASELYTDSTVRSAVPGRKQ